MNGHLIWKDFKTAVSLKTIIRQGKQEKESRDALTNLSEYKATPSRAKWFQQFQWDNLKKT